MEDFKLQVEKLTRDLASALQSIKIYTGEHPRSKEAVSKLFKELREIFLSRDTLSLGVVEEEIFFEKEIFFSLSSQLKDFIKTLKSKGIEKIIFKSSLNQEELLKFLNLLALRNVPGEEVDFAAILGETGVKNIEVGRLGDLRTLTQQRIPQELLEKLKGLKELEKLKYLKGISQELLHRGEEAISKSLSENQPDYSSVFNIASSIFSLGLQNQDLLLAISGLKQYDDSTFVHCLNVANLTMFQARILGFPKEKVVDLGIAGFFHDIGKIAIKRELIQKKGKLTPEEFRKVKNHTFLGAKLILKSLQTKRLPLIVSFAHHIGFSKEGYPRPIVLKRQNLGVMLVCISDVYDALRSRRSYRGTMSFRRVYEIMAKEKGRLFEPNLLDLFFENLGVWPVGTLVKLNTSEVGIVIKNNPQQIFRPRVEILYDSSAHKLEKSFVVDLGEESQKHKSIIGHLSWEEGAERFSKDFLSGEELI